MMSDSHELDQALQMLLSQLSPIQIRKAMREIATYLRKENISNIKAQRNVDSSKYAPRKKKKVRRKMLTKFGKHIKKKVDINKLQVGIFGQAGNLANIHHQGETEKGIKYPARNLLGFSPEIKQGIRDILLKHISAHP